MGRELLLQLIELGGELLVCLGSGAVLNAAIGRYQGKGGDEQTLLRALLDTLARGDVLVGDA